MIEHGVKTAAERMFRVPLGQLNIGQSALLAGLIQNPDGYNPFAHPERSAARRVEVLKGMEQEHYVTKVEAYPGLIACEVRSSSTLVKPSTTCDNSR